MSDNNLGAAWPRWPPSQARGPLHFLTLGQLLLQRESDKGLVVVSQRRKLAVLAFLALARRPVSRAALAEMFWGDEEEERARHSLSTTLSFLRGLLGPSSIATRKADLSLAPDSTLRIDAVELLSAAKAGDHGRVVDIYAGPFLEGMFVAGSVSFENWVLSERSRLETVFTKSCAAVCTITAGERNWERCAAVARRWLDVSPLAPEAALHLLNATRAGKTPAHRRAALEEYQRLVAHLTREFSAEPHIRVKELAHEIAERVAVDRDAAAAAVPESDASSEQSLAIQSASGASSAISTSSTVHDETVRSHRFTNWSRRWAFAAAVLAVAIALRYSRHANSNSIQHQRPLMVVTDIANLRRDTAAAWLEDGLAQLISADLARSAAVEVVTPDRMRDTRRRADLPTNGALDQRTAMGLANRLGASLVVRGGFTHGNGVYVLDLSVGDVASSRTVHSLTVSGPDPMALADQSAARILQWSVADEPKTHFADIETANIAAYEHFVRSLQARAEGRIQDWKRELDNAIALDSAFASALVERYDVAREDGDTIVLARLARAMGSAHFSAWDLRRAGVASAMHNGELARSERLANDLVTRYPHDPRSYSVLAELYALHGNWALSERTAERQLALDSLANEAGNGPCVPCEAYRGLVETRLARGDVQAAEQAARRWIALQPDLPGAWGNLAETLFYAGRYDAALDAERRATMLSGNDPDYMLRLARSLIVARQFVTADSLARSWHGDDPVIRAGVVDIHVLVLREQGRYRESIRESDTFLRTHRRNEALLYEEMDALGRLGDYDLVNRIFDQRIASPGDTRAMQTAPHGDAARWFTWTRALEANALAGSGDTLRLRAIADSMQTIAPRSYYGRDWRLYHHVLGLIAMRTHRYGVAEREFQLARWGVGGWTATVAWLARAEIADHKPAAAVATLRQGYQSSLDAMGRYVPRSELDYMMSIAFRQMAEHDSADVYAARVRHAWSRADPEVRRLLVNL